MELGGAPPAQRQCDVESRRRAQAQSVVTSKGHSPVARLALAVADSVRISSGEASGAWGFPGSQTTLRSSARVRQPRRGGWEPPPARLRRGAAPAAVNGWGCGTGTVGFRPRFGGPDGGRSPSSPQSRKPPPRSSVQRRWTASTDPDCTGG